MARGRRSFDRKSSTRSYRKRFVIATEGQETEPRYFAMFNTKNSTVQVILLKSKRRTSPSNVFDRLKKADIGKKDHAWIVIDRDTWKERELNQVHKDCKSHSFKMALSNPMFEYWLLLHFEDGNGVTASNVKGRLKAYLPNFSKTHIEIHKIQPGVDDAIRRAKRKDTPPCDKWPKVTGSTVYSLVKELQDAASD